MVSVSSERLVGLHDVAAIALHRPLDSLEGGLHDARHTRQASQGTWARIDTGCQVDGWCTCAPVSARLVHVARMSIHWAPNT